MDSYDINENYNGNLLAKNTIYNLLGYGIPLLFALAIIPFLIKGLGKERFGILSLVWVVIGYFSFFDFGIGRALTKVIAEKIGLNQVKDIPSIFWTSFFIIVGVSLIGVLTLLFLAPVLVYDFFNISKNLQVETLDTFYILAISIPIVTTTAGIRGVLEAYQKFGIINIIRTMLGVFSFLGPLFCLFFTNSLFWIVLFLTFVRVVVWVLYLWQCFKLNTSIKHELNFDSSLIKPLLKLSGWMTVSNIIVPIIIYIDRFFIGALVSAAAIAYYTTPYEAVTKLLLIPGAVVGVLFPAFSANYLNNPYFTKELSLKAVKYIFIILYPLILSVIVFANEGMTIWIGKNFAEESTFILQLLAVGVLFNSIAYIPFTFLQGIGKPEITAKIQLVELPLYMIVMWIGIKHEGINGAAFVWMLRMVIDALILFIFARREISSHFEFSFKLSYLLIFILIIASIFPVFLNDMNLKIIMVFMIILTFLFITWKFFLINQERIFILSHLRLFNSQK